MSIPLQHIEAAATAIANVRGMRRGAPMVPDILDALRSVLQPGARRTLYDDLIEEATAALEAVAALKP